MPKDLSEEAVAEWLYDAAVLMRMQSPGFPLDRYAEWDEVKPVVRGLWMATARAVLALVREKVREAVEFTMTRAYSQGKGRIIWDTVESVVSRVMGDHPSGGHDEGRPAREGAPRG
jgi:hypothetical protein